MNHIKHVTCSCEMSEHTLVFKNFASVDEDFPVCVETYLYAWEPWYKRLWVGIKYIFGYKCKYGEFDSTMLDWQRVILLRDMLNEILLEQPKRYIK